MGKSEFAEHKTVNHTLDEYFKDGAGDAVGRGVLCDPQARHHR